MSPEIQLTREMVDGVRKGIRERYGIRFWPGELNNTVLETFADQFGLPWKKTKGSEHLDFSDPRVKDVQRQLEAFPDNPVGQAKILRILGNEGQVTEIPYSSSIPDMETLAAIAVPSGIFRFIFAGLADVSGEKRVVFATYENLGLVAAALRREDQELRKSAWHVARISLTEPGKLQWLFLAEEWGEDDKKTENVKELLSRINPSVFHLEHGGRIPVLNGHYGTLYRFNTATRELKQRVTEGTFQTESVGTVPALYETPQS